MLFMIQSEVHGHVTQYLDDYLGVSGLEDSSSAHRTKHSLKLKIAGMKNPPQRKNHLQGKGGMGM